MVYNFIIHFISLRKLFRKLVGWKLSTFAEHLHALPNKNGNSFRALIIREQLDTILRKEKIKENKKRILLLNPCIFVNLPHSTLIPLSAISYFIRARSRHEGCTRPG